ncbi:hypothetical protein AU509_11955 [Lonsdalea britannica]|uniref:BstA-like C-terminal domain-containing protein n=1 Tax=Lonsdalea britannica TaxID=1082704 RepID=A0AAD0SI92_9GAMM|nr:hypothetical protein [Lonsdalea britannica]AXW87790.1 hypothetical protein CKQ53_12965 [Lonsdalea britannica]OSM95915.1 hypothetical protein AU509_11955 [Lonsdalea britannica]
MSLPEKKKSQRSPSNHTIPLDLDIKQEGVIHGVEMGVLDNGIPYLTQSGLATVCGVQRLRIKEITDEWYDSVESGIFKKGKMTFIGSYLLREGFAEPKLFIPVMKKGTENHAYPDVVCMAIIEYYAFESKQAESETALRSYRELAKKGLKEYIYEALKYKPEDPWKHYHDRVSILKEMGSVPDGFYIIFNEISGMMVDLIQAGLLVNAHTVPDGSVGSCWANFWKKNSLSSKFGDATDCEHFYPDDFAQAKSNPQIINAYPNSSLPEFRRWFRHEYLPTKFPPYILKKANLLAGGKDDAQKLIEAFKPLQISKP